MSKNKTHIAIILDKSGSMYRAAKGTISGFNEQVQQIRANAKEADIHVSLITFNGNVYEHLWEQPADLLCETNDKDYVPEGSTAMYDAVGYTIDKLKSSGDKDNYLLIIMSDGAENASSHVKADELKEKIDSLNKTGRWTFTYMGCDESYLKKVSYDVGIPISNMASFNNSADGTHRAMRFAACATSNYIKTSSLGASMPDHFYSEADSIASIDSADSLSIPQVDPRSPNPNVSVEFKNVLGSGTAVTWTK